MMQKVGRFQILHRILTGETDAVYLVADPEAERKLALKMVQLDWFAGADRATQLRQDLWNDVYKARRLRHPAIIVPEDVFEQLGVCWFVMDFVQGQDLGQVFAQKTQLEKPMARSMARQMAEALDHVHQAGLTHGRLRPSKVMLSSEGSVRILGLGMSRVSFSGREGNGHGIKSPHYVSPEQLAGEGSCAQSDQFAMAAIVYQLLAGSKAFPGEGDEVRLDITERDPLPAEELNPTLDPAVSRVLARALAKSPKARFPTCVEFAAALDEALEASPDWVVPVPTERPRVLPPVQDLAQDASLASTQSVAPSEALAYREALAQGEVGTHSEALAQSEAVTNKKSAAKKRASAKGKLLPRGEVLGGRESLTPSEAVVPSEALGQNAAVDERQDSSQDPVAPLTEPETRLYGWKPPAAAWLRWPKLAFPVMAVAALLAIAGIYVAYRAGAPAADPRVSSQAAQPLQITSAELPVGKVGNSYSAHLSAEGESAPYHWTLAEGSLPPGLTLEDSGEIRGTPAATGVFPVSVSVSSASSHTASAPLTVQIDSDLAIVTPPDLPGGAIGQRYATRLAAAEAREPAVWSVADGTLPAGLSLDAASGTLQGVPAKAGVFPFTLRVRDASEAVDEQAFTLRLGSGLTITTPGVLPRSTVSQRDSAKLSAAAGSPPLRWSVKSGSLAPGLSLNAADGTLGGSPSRPGKYQFTVEATDVSQAVASQAFTLEVDTGLRIMSQAALPGATMGSRYSHALLSERGEQPLRWTVLGGSLPPGLSLSSSSGIIEGSPSAAGRFSFDARVTDASNTTASQRFSLDVAVPLVMVTSAGLQNGVIGKEYLQGLEARGGAPPYQWSLASGSLPQGLSLDESRSTIRGVPAAAGAFPLRLRVRDAAGTTLESAVNLEIGAQLSMATSPDLPAADAAEEYSLVLTALGGRPPYTWSVIDGNLPPDVSLDASSGRVRGRPGRTGDFLFSARVSDSAGAQAQRTFRLNVASSLRLSSAPMLPEATQGQPYSHTLTAAGGRSPYQWSVQGELPAGLALDSSSGVIQGTPAAEGRFSFQIQLRGAAGETASRSAGLLVKSAASGQIVWRGNLEANRVLTIQDGRYPSSGALTGALPGVPIEIEIEPQGLMVVTPPGPGNDWKLLVIHGGDQPRTEMIIRWKRAQ